MAVSLTHKESSLATHSLIVTLKNLRGNARGCVLTEPLWGIPFNLYSPYVSIYMLALGLTDSKIGLIVSVGTAFQVIWTLMSGAITDKLGRKRTTLIFDALSWSVPCLIWAAAQNFDYFLVAAMVNAVWRVTDNSWSCLLVEDTEPSLLIDIWSWIQIAGLLSAFFAPLTGLIIGRFGLVSTMRGLYLLAFVMMTTKFLATNAMVSETQQGRVRMAETAHQPVFAIVKESPAVLKQILKTPATLYTAALMLILNVSMSIRGTFWPVLASKEIGIPAEHLALYPFARSVTMMVFFFLVMPRLKRMAALSRIGESVLMITGFGLFIVSQALLVVAPVGNIWVLYLVAILEGCALPLTSTMMAKLTVVTVDPKERARIMAWLSAIVLLAASPFGWVAGQLSSLNRRYPFVLVVVLFTIGGLITLAASRSAHRTEVLVGDALVPEA